MATLTIAPQAAHVYACTQCFRPAPFATDVYLWIIAPNGDTLVETTNENYCGCVDLYETDDYNMWLPASLVGTLRPI